MVNIDIARALQLAIMRPLGHVRFKAQLIPDWWPNAFGAVETDVVEIELPFLRDFIEHDAQSVWIGREDHLLASPLFEVSTREESLLHLQALAVRQDQQNALVIRNMDTIDDWLAPMLRKARSNLLSHSQDRTEHRKEVSSIQADRDEAVRMEKVKSEFLANMSHEIRTPLTTILGMAAMAQKATQTECRQEYIDGIVGAANRLLRLGNDILDLSRIQAERLELDVMQFSVKEVMEEFETEWKLHTNQCGLTFDQDVAADTPDSVIGDSFRLRQVLTNLVGNALKFTEVGGINLTIKPSISKASHLRFEVRDTGLGISRDQQSRIFETFTQVDQSSHRQRHGAGLGLTIATNLVRLMGGKIQVESEPGKGSCFYFDAYLPASDPILQQNTADLASGVPNEQNLAMLSVLVAEDHALNRSIIVETLQSEGIQTIEAENGRMAVEAWRDRDIDVVLMDCQMPILSGLDAIRIIRDEEGERRTPIIALTAHAMHEDRQRLLDHGADQYLAKPFDREELIRLVVKLGIR